MIKDRNVAQVAIKDQPLEKTFILKNMEGLITIFPRDLE